MANLNQKNIFIQIRIKEQTEIGEFNDSLYYTQEEFNNLSEMELQNAIKIRVDKWVAFVKEQPKIIPVEPTKEELEVRKLELEMELNEIISKIATK